MSTTRRIFLSAPAALALLLACAWPAARAQSCKQPAWPQWDRFAQRHLQADGRIVDFSVPARQSTSEGQSYGMFFALVANDRERFANLWRWSRGNLGAGGDRLPAWQWGKRENSDAYGVLDPLIRAEMQEQLLQLQAGLNKTIVFITHDLDEAMRLGNRIAILRDGVLLQEGTPAEILEAPADEHVRRFVEKT